MNMRYIAPQGEEHPQQALAAQVDMCTAAGVVLLETSGKYLGLHCNAIKATIDSFRNAPSLSDVINDPSKAIHYSSDLCESIIWETGKLLRESICHMAKSQADFNHLFTQQWQTLKQASEAVMKAKLY